MKASGSRNDLVGSSSLQTFRGTAEKEIPMSTMRAFQVSRKGGPLEAVERPIPQPGAGSVRIKVQACGICHSDVLTKEGAWPGITYPRVPGHEVIGVIDAVGQNVPPTWPVGQRVGVGWHSSHCGYCNLCRRGEFFACQTGVGITGVTLDGGYAEYMIAPATALAMVPEHLPTIDAAPLMCAGLTTFNALRNSGAGPGDVAAILGIGGLGHLGVQYAAKMGLQTVAIARGQDKEPLARQLGAAHYIDSQNSDPAAELQKLGGAKVIIATVTHGPAMAATVGGLAPYGKLMAIGAVESLESSPIFLLAGRRSIAGWYSGTSIDSEDTLAFSVQSGVRSMNEIYPLERAPEAFDRMLSGKARFRVVLSMDR
jgi:D-arabinose 1-dehydrogenase-like Zn-dependent alcohol dehydrogenase